MKKIKRFVPFLVLASIILLAFSPLFINGGFIGDFGDPVGQTIPNKFLLVEYLKNGLLPLWNSFSFMGFPFLADIQVGAFYPSDILFFSLFSPLVAHNISILFHLIFAGLGTYLFVKSLTKNKPLSISLALTLVLGGTFLTKIVYLNFLETISYIPWILFVMSVKTVRVWILALLFALMIFAGHPIAFLYSLIIIGLFFLINYLKKWKALIISFLLGLLISCVQIIPFVELKMNSVRDSLSYDQFTEGSLSFRELLGFLTPFKHGMNNPFDTYIHFGVLAFAVLIISLFFFKKFKKAEKKIYITGIVLCVFGVILALGGNIPFLSKTLYHLPVLNLIRVPARYIILFHFGAIFSIAVFLKYLFSEHKKVGIVLSVLLIINSLLLPSLFLDRHEIADASAQYFPEISESLEISGNTEFSLYTPPQYFLSSSFFLFPNRHILNFMPNVIGYNPMILKNFYNTFPVLPVGAFEDPDYFTNYYQKFRDIGLKYYIFPSESFLKEHDLEAKTSVIKFLQNGGWNKVSADEDYDVWQSPFNHDFAYFENDKNQVKSINFSPGKIDLEVEVSADDLLVVNQSFYKGWTAVMGNGDSVDAEIYDGYLQFYDVPHGTNTITVSYESRTVLYGLLGTILGVIMLIFSIIYDQKINK